MKANQWSEFLGDDRGVSTTLGYILNLTVATLVIGGLLITGGDAVREQREQTIQSELTVIGQQLAADLVAADELATTANAGDTIEIQRELPRDVAGRTYTIEIGEADGNTPYLLLSPTRSDITVRIEMTLETPLAESSVTGQQVLIHYVDVDGDSVPELEVTHA